MVNKIAHTPKKKKHSVEENYNSISPATIGSILTPIFSPFPHAKGLRDQKTKPSIS